MTISGDFAYPKLEPKLETNTKERISNRISDLVCSAVQSTKRLGMLNLRRSGWVLAPLWICDSEGGV